MKIMEKNHKMVAVTIIVGKMDLCQAQIYHILLRKYNELYRKRLIFKHSYSWKNIRN